MNITGTHFNYYHLCTRKLWLFANGLQMEHTSDLVYEGKLVHENSYPQRSGKYEEVEIEGCKIDYFDSKNKIIHEIKKSDKIEIAHEWQVKYYIYVFEKNGIKEVSGIIEYPLLKQTKKVDYTADDKVYIEAILDTIAGIIDSKDCPARINSKICRNCSYYDFCYIEESLSDQ